MTEHQQNALDRHEKELRPGLPPLDRTVDLDPCVLAERVSQMRDMFHFSNWPKEKILAAAICYLCFFGYNPEEERAIAERIRESTQNATEAGKA